MLDGFIVQFSLKFFDIMRRGTEIHELLLECYMVVFRYPLALVFRYPLRHFFFNLRVFIKE